VSEHREGTFPGAGGPEIYWQAWLPAGVPRADIVLTHGGGEHSGRYAYVAERLNERGYALWALDHRGHGRSAGRRGMIDRLEHALADIATLVAMATAERAGRRPFLLGHSVGAALAVAYAIRRQGNLSGLVLTGGVLALETAARPTRMISTALSGLVPGLGIFGVDPGEVSRDPEIVRAYETDPLVHHGKLPVRTLAELVREGANLPERSQEIRLPALIMHGTADSIAPPRGSETLHERISSADKMLRLWDGLYHEILNEPERDEVIAEIVAWLDART
jgi:acylglycerol lipase